jgi:hypothetical protein
LDAIALRNSDRISSLSLDQLSALVILAGAQTNATALLNFNSIDDLNHWLEANG